MKGQFFLIAGVIVLIFILLVRSSLRFEEMTHETNEIIFEIENFLNLKKQLIKTFAYSYDKNTSEKVISFIKFAKKKLNPKTFELSGIFIQAFYKNVTQNEEEFLNLTIYNFLGEKIFNLSLNFSNELQFFSELQDDSTLHVSFQFSTQSNQNYTLIVSYSTLKREERYWIEIPVEIDKSKAVGFFDLKLKGLHSILRDEFSKLMEIV
ncbi:MAG: hypothetical protein QW451_01045 [Candidatus Aenigmatarchaeota archaeon]